MSMIGSLGKRLGKMFGLRGKSNDMSGSTIDRASRPFGVWTDALAAGFVPRDVNPYFYEALREAVPMLDGGINRLVTLDGIVRVRGKNEALVNRIRTELLEKIPVNDNEIGLQAFYASQSNEIYEQGFSVGECVMDSAGVGLVGLRVADSKGVAFKRIRGRLHTYYRPVAPKHGGRRDGTDEVETVLRASGMGALPTSVVGEYSELPADRLVHASYQSEADNPYGTSIMRSVEFVAQILLRIHNATGQVWDRFGDPPMQLVYKTKARLQQADLDKRRDRLAADLQKVLSAKRGGASADFVQAIGADDEIAIKVIGGDGNPLEIEMPARHMVEQILAKFGLPSWMLGVQWSTAERMADQQAEMALQESRTRFERRRPGLATIVETWLRGVGVTWETGDWELYQELPSLRDVVKRAQAKFLLAQTALMRGGEVDPEDMDLLDAEADAKMFRVEHDGGISFFHPRLRTARGHRHRARVAAADDEDGDDEAEPWAESDPELPGIEHRAISGMLALWRGVRDDTLRVLGLAGSGKGGVPAFEFDAMTQLAELLRRINEFVAAATGEDGPLLREMFAAWVRGISNAAPAGTDVAAAIEASRATMVTAMSARATQFVPPAALRAFTLDILADLQAGAYDGLNPREVARRLRARFAAHDYDWERLARSEIARAQGAGKLDQYARMGATHVDWIYAPTGACARCVELGESGPYPLESAPMIVDDSHPNCRCTLAAAIAT